MGHIICPKEGIKRSGMRIRLQRSNLLNAPEESKISQESDQAKNNGFIVLGALYMESCFTWINPTVMANAIASITRLVTSSSSTTEVAFPWTREVAPTSA